MATKRPISNPFDSFDEADHGSSLSGRDPYGSPMVHSSPPTKRNTPYVAETPHPSRHRFSSSEDEIVEAHIEEEEEYGRARGKNYFSEIVGESESVSRGERVFLVQREEEAKPYFKQAAVPSIIKHASAVHQDSSASEISHTTGQLMGLA